MRADQLARQRVQRLEMSGVYPLPELPASRLVVWGIHGGSEFVTGLQIGETHLQRTGSPTRMSGSGHVVWSGESCDELWLRAVRDVTPTLSPTALRDKKGTAVGYFTYSGLPADHCKRIAEQEGRL